MDVAVSPVNANPIDRFIAEMTAHDPKFSKTSFADLAGCSRGAIYRVINGDDAVSTDLIERIAAATTFQPAAPITEIELFAAWKRARDARRAAAEERARA
jgi:hypothetical protein